MQVRRIAVLGIAIVAFIAVWVAVKPWYAYWIDADAVGYLTVAKRAAAGDWLRSINGLWSPLNSWLLVPFINKGFNAFEVAQYINAALAIAVLLLTEHLLHKYVANTFYKSAVTLCLPIVLVFFSYLQVFGDLLQLAFVLLYLVFCSRKNYFSNYFLLFLNCVVVALATLAKAYTLPFFALHSIAWYFAMRKSTHSIAAWKIAVQLGLVLALLVPWGLQLQKKYGSFSFTGNAGKLNMSWYINSGKSFKPEIGYLIPPTYDDSPSFWEDPFLSSAALTTPTSSGAACVKWLARVVHTCFQAIGCSNQISFFILPVLLLYYFFVHKKVERDRGITALFISALVVPLGYLAMHIEARYIWLLLPCTLVFCGVLLQKIENVFLQKCITALLIVSFASWPIIEMQNCKYKGKQNIELANVLKQLNIEHKKIISNKADAGDMWVAALQSNNYYYTIEKSITDSAQLQNEITHYAIHYAIIHKQGEIVNLPIKAGDTVFGNSNFLIVAMP